MNPPGRALPQEFRARGCNRTPSAHSVKEVVTATETVLMAGQMADQTSKLMRREEVAEGTMACLSGEPRFVRDLGGLASRAHSRLPGYDGVFHRPARASGIFRDAPAVQYQTDVLLSLTTCSRLSLASQFRDTGLSRHRSFSMVFASCVRNLRDGGRHCLGIQSPYYLCTRGSRYRSATCSRTRVITLRQSETSQMLGSRSKYSSSSFFPPSPAPNCFSDWINSMRSIHLTIL